MDDKKRGTPRLSAGLPLNSMGRQEKIVYEGMTEADRIRERVNRIRDLSKITVIPARPEPGLFDPNFRKRVVVYCRVSTDGLGQVTSFENQKKYYVGMVRKKPEWHLVALYSDEGLTATGTKKRIGLLQMIEDARAGKFDIIIVKNLSRLSRNLMDCMEIIYELRKLPKPVDIFFENENMFTLDRTVDFTLQVLSLVAQEESHKKSEAMLGSYRARFHDGQFMKPDLLGYDRSDVNELSINEEEARTVRLIFMMYLGGVSLEGIAEVLTMLGRKTHSHTYKDGRVKEGIVRWTASSVKNIMENERRAGMVIAQKTYTLDYLTHETRRNDNVKEKFYAVDQHDAIIHPADFELAQQMLHANRRGWKEGLQELQVFQEGGMKGFVSTVPNWLGFGAEDYNRACLRGYGMEETRLEELGERMYCANLPGLDESGTPLEDNNAFHHQTFLDSDDYEAFPEEEVPKEVVEQMEVEESFATWVEEYRKVLKNKSTPKRRGYDLSDCEVVRPHLMSLREKACVTIDRLGMSFNKGSFNLMQKDGALELGEIEVYYNPLEKILLVRPVSDSSARTMNWIKKAEDGRVSMKRCCCKGLSSSIYQNMGWDEDSRYRLVGSCLEFGGETVLAFGLESPVVLVSYKVEDKKDIDTEQDEVNAKEKNRTIRRVMRDGFMPPENTFIPNLTSFNLGDGPIAKDAKRMSRSRVIYFNDLLEQSNGKISVVDMGSRKFDPDYIRQMLCDGLAPEEGWIYLRGMGEVKKNHFKLYPAEWEGTFGVPAHESEGNRIRELFHRRKEGIGTGIAYGWTVGLDLPTKETIEEAIELLRAEYVG